MVLKTRGVSWVYRALVFGVSLGLVSAASAVELYYAKIEALTARTNGDVVVNILPGATETGFTGRKKLIIPAAQPGTNRLVAVSLSAMALNVEVTVATDLSLEANPTQVPLQIAVTANP